MPETSRVIAARLLEAILVNRRPLDQMFAVAVEGLTSSDRAFVRLLVATALRRLGTLDILIDRCLVHDLAAKDRLARQILRLGIGQLLFLKTPPYAAINSSVASADALGLTHLKPLINAVLRRLAKTGPAMLAELPPTSDVPEWLARRWRATYGEAGLAAIAAAHRTEPPLDLTLKNPAEIALWAERLGALILPTGTLRLTNAGAVENLPGFNEGAWWVQDAAASLPVRLLGSLKGLSVLDLCAAPGGKAAQIAALGGSLTALDRSPKRLALVKQNFARLGLQGTLITADATKWDSAERFDAILLDAPCSSTGTLRRNPDIAWLKSERDLTALTALQDRLLDAAARLLAPGSILVYATCSLEPDEGETRIAAFLDRTPELHRAPIGADEIPGIADFITPEGDLRTLPSGWAELGHLDGFYAARLRRIDACATE